MKTLLRPALRPSPGSLKSALELSGIASVVGCHDLEESVTGILSELKCLSSAQTALLEERIDQGDASLRTHVFSVGDANTGNVQISYGGKDTFTMGAMLFWSFLPPSIDEVVAGIDRIWAGSAWRTLYAYDGDDHSVQNCTMVLGMEDLGLVRDQVDFINRYGIVEEIDTRANPGFMLNQDGLFWSIQWLNYWGETAQKHMFGARLREFPAGVRVNDLGQGAIRVCLSEKPGSFDDIEFHELQLECRRRLPFAAPFKLRED